MVDINLNLLGTITDGDIRRGFLKGLKLSDKIKNFKQKIFLNSEGHHLKKDAFKIMKKKYILSTSFTKKKLVDIFFFENYLFKGTRIKNDFIILAGDLEKIIPTHQKCSKTHDYSEE